MKWRFVVVFVFGFFFLFNWLSTLVWLHHMPLSSLLPWRETRHLLLKVTPASSPAPRCWGLLMSVVPREPEPSSPGCAPCSFPCAAAGTASLPALPLSRPGAGLPWGGLPWGGLPGVPPAHPHRGCGVNKPRTQWVQCSPFLRGLWGLTLVGRVRLSCVAPSKHKAGEGKMLSR